MSSSRPSGLQIAYLISRYPAVSHTFIMREIDGLRRLGATIRVASVNAPDRAMSDMPPTELAESLQTYYIKHDGLNGALRALAWALLTRPANMMRMLRESLHHGRRLFGLAYAIEALMVARWMDAHAMTHLHVHFGNAAASVGTLVKQLTGCKLSLTIHGPDEFDDVIGQSLVRKACQADQVICISQFARSQLMRLTPPAHWHKLQRCHLGVEARPTELTRPKRPSGAPTRLLCVGRLTPAKAQSLLIACCRNILDTGRELSLTMVGDGPDRQALQQQVARLGLSDHVHFTGALTSEHVEQAMRQADIFVLPSLAEGIPVVLMEAMASGLPCVSTPVNGIPELIRHGIDGLLATPGDVASLQAHITQLMDDADARQRIAQSASARVRSLFNLERNVRQLNGLFLSGHRDTAPSSASMSLVRGQA